MDLEHYLCVGGVEIVNACRTLGYIEAKGSGYPAPDPAWRCESCPECCCSGYDFGPYTAPADPNDGATGLDRAPWWDDLRATEAGGFFGFLPTRFELSESLVNTGGTQFRLGRVREAKRTLTIEGDLVSNSCASTRYGREWLIRTLNRCIAAGQGCGGTDGELFAHCADDCGGPSGRRDIHQVRFVSLTTTSDPETYPCCEGERVVLVLEMADPYLYGPTTAVPIDDPVPDLADASVSCYVDALDGDPDPDVIPAEVVTVTAPRDQRTITLRRDGTWCDDNPDTGPGLDCYEWVISGAQEADDRSEGNECPDQRCEVELTFQTDVPGGRAATHTVVSGDTIWGIAQTYSVSMDDIVAWNNGQPPSTKNLTSIDTVIHPGDVLIVGRGVTYSGGSKAVSHTVVAGDTLWDIAAAYDTTVNAIVKLNPDISDPNLIYPGQVIVVAAKPADGSDGRPPWRGTWRGLNWTNNPAEFPPDLSGWNLCEDCDDFAVVAVTTHYEPEPEEDPDAPDPKWETHEVGRSDRCRRLRLEADGSFTPLDGWDPGVTGMPEENTEYLAIVNCDPNETDPEPDCPEVWPVKINPWGTWESALRGFKVDPYAAFPPVGLHRFEVTNNPDTDCTRTDTIPAWDAEPLDPSIIPDTLVAPTRTPYLHRVGPYCPPLAASKVWAQTPDVPCAGDFALVVKVWTGATDLRHARLKVWRIGPAFGTDLAELIAFYERETPCAIAEIGWAPKGSTLVIDSAHRDIRVTHAGGMTLHGALVTGERGRSLHYPIVDGGARYLVGLSFDICNTADDVTLEVDLVARELA